MLRRNTFLVIFGGTLVGRRRYMYIWIVSLATVAMRRQPKNLRMLNFGYFCCYFLILWYYVYLTVASYDRLLGNCIARHRCLLWRINVYIGQPLQILRSAHSAGYSPEMLNFPRGLISLIVLVPEHSRRNLTGRFPPVLRRGTSVSSTGGPPRTSRGANRGRFRELPDSLANHPPGERKTHHGIRTYLEL